MEEPRAVLAAIIAGNRGFGVAYERGRDLPPPPNDTDIVVSLYVCPASASKSPDLEDGEMTADSDACAAQWLWVSYDREQLPSQSHCRIGLENRPGVLITPLRFKLIDLTSTTVSLPDTACLVFQESNDRGPLENMVFKGVNTLLSNSYLYSAIDVF